MTNYARTVSLVRSSSARVANGISPSFTSTLLLFLQMSVVIIIGFLLLIDKKKVLPRHFKTDSQSSSSPEEPAPSEERISWKEGNEDPPGDSWEPTINSSDPQSLPGNVNHLSQWNLSTGSRSSFAFHNEDDSQDVIPTEDDEEYVEV